MTWSPFRPSPEDLDRLRQDVAPIEKVRRRLLQNHPDLLTPDRVAHQYQISGGRIVLKIDPELPDNLRDVGVFAPGSRHTGICRISTGLGNPHVETDPDFLGFAAAFKTSGKRVDFLAINDPGSPTDTHQEFVELLAATAEGAAAEPPFGDGVGELDLMNLFASNLALVRSLISRMGLRRGGGTALHVLGQTLRTARSATACQRYWTGIVEAGGQPGKFMIVPEPEDASHRTLRPGERYLSDEWAARQQRRPISFGLHWLPYSDERATSTTDLTEGWQETSVHVATLELPQVDPQSSEAQRWAALAAEMGMNPGNWIRDREDSIPQPGTEFTCARQLAYRLSQSGRDALAESAYDAVFSTGRIDEELAGILDARRAAKIAAGHVDSARNTP